MQFLFNTKSIYTKKHSYLSPKRCDKNAFIIVLASDRCLPTCYFLFN